MREYRAPDPDLPAAWAPYWKSFTRALRAIPRSERTIKAYGYALRDLGRYLQPAPPPLEAVTQEQLESFMASLHKRLRPNGAAIHYRGLRRFFNWLVEEGDLDQSPMRRIGHPEVPDEPLEVLELEEVARLLKTCQGRSFEDRRDAAIIRLLIDSGVRLGGVTSMTVSGTNLDRSRALVRAKGGDIYMIRRRSREAKLNFRRAVHVFRHSFSHYFRMNGGDEGDLQVLGGWKSRAMLSRYGKALEVQRARAAHQRFSPGDRI